MNSILSRIATIFSLALSAHASMISFTITGVADTTSLGYSNGQAVSFTLITGENFDYYTALTTPQTSYNSWIEKFDYQEQLFMSVQGTGIGGSYIRPALSYDDPSSSIYTFNGVISDMLQLYVSASGSNTGMTTPVGTKILEFKSQSTVPFEFSFPSVYAKPVTYFSNYIGVYSSFGSISIKDVTGELATFTANGLSISLVSDPAPVPEPATYALLIGLSILCFTSYRCFKNNNTTH